MGLRLGLGCEGGRVGVGVGVGLGLGLELGCVKGYGIDLVMSDSRPKIKEEGVRVLVRGCEYLRGWLGCLIWRL